MTKTSIYERALETYITSYAKKKLGYFTYKNAPQGVKGIPDRIFITPLGCIFYIEFKSPTGRVSPMQEHTIYMLKYRYNVPVYVVNNKETGIAILEHHSTNRDLYEE